MFRHKKDIDFSAVDELAGIVSGSAHNYALDYDQREWNRKPTVEKEALSWLASAMELSECAAHAANELRGFLKLTDDELEEFKEEGIVRRFYTEQELLEHDHHEEWWQDFMTAAARGPDALRAFERTPWKPKHKETEE